MKIHKYERILGMYQALLNDQIVVKDEMANRYNVDGRTIQRDIDDIRTFLANATVLTGYMEIEIIYDRNCGGYRVA